jgi:ATP phosphoribosyltransferase
VDKRDSMLRLLLPNNGHLYSGTMRLLKDAGFSFQKHPRQLYTVCETYGVELAFVRGVDIPWYLAQGVGDLGITGYDLLYERGIDLGPCLGLGYSTCRLSVCVPQDSLYQDVASLVGTQVATSHPNTTRYFFNQWGLDIEIVTLKGALEIAPHLGVCQATVCLVDTGVTNAINGIRVIADLLSSQATLVGSPQYAPHKKRQVERMQGIILDAARAYHAGDESALATEPVVLAQSLPAEICRCL